MSHEAAIASFTGLIQEVTGLIGAAKLDAELDGYLNEKAGPDSALFHALSDACRAGVAEGWLCSREHGGIKFGRIIKPTDATGGFSVDVVEMNDCAGPHHAHPTGEIDMIMPLDAGAEFDERGEGWLVYGPGTAHSPTVRGGKAIVLYLLPDGAIDFTK